MNDIEQLKREVVALKERNARVEADKAWETSLARKLLIAALTYILVVIFFTVAHLSRPFVSAIVPTLGFVLSTLSVPYFKNLWLRSQRSKGPTS